MKKCKHSSLNDIIKNNRILSLVKLKIKYQKTSHSLKSTKHINDKEKNKKLINTQFFFLNLFFKKTQIYKNIKHIYISNLIYKCVNKL